MFAILIDPSAKTITPTELSSDFRDISKQLQCNLFTSLRLNDSAVMFLDDEGLFKESPSLFKLRDYPSPLAGRALVVGTDEEGETQPCPLTLEEVQSLISWFPGRLVGFERTVKTHGKLTILSHRPLFSSEH